MLAAIQMSLADCNPPPPVASTNDNTSTTTAIAPAIDTPDTANDTIDADFMNQLLGSVDADINDPLIQAALAQLQGDKGTDKDKDSDKDKEK